MAIFMRNHECYLATIKASKYTKYVCSIKIILAIVCDRQDHDKCIQLEMVIALWLSTSE